MVSSDCSSAIRIHNRAIRGVKNDQIGNAADAEASSQALLYVFVREWNGGIRHGGVVLVEVLLVAVA